MKLRLCGDSLRLRLSPEDVRKLQETGSVRESTAFGDGAELVYSLEEKLNGTGLAASYSPGVICVTVSSQLMSRWLSSDDLGISGTQNIGPGRSLSILIEKDLHCLDRSKDEPGVALYPNPDQGHT